MVAFDLTGQLQSIKPFHIADLNLCTARMSYNEHIMFGESRKETCRIDLKSVIELGESRPWFYSLYLNYTENNVNLMKAVPVLIRNSASLNAVS